jgi:hypothetical protein
MSITAEDFYNLYRRAGVLDQLDAAIANERERAAIDDKAILNYINGAIAAAHANGRAEGLREALAVARDCATESGDWIAAAIERLLTSDPK